MSRDRRVSVVIPTHQRRASLERALAALSRQTLSPADYEIVVAIDGSTDGSRELVEGFSAPCAIECVWKSRGGRASACNAGLRRAGSPLVVFLDDDMEATPGWLAAHLATHLAAHAAGQRLGVVGAVPIAVDDRSPAVTRYVAGKFNGHLRTIAQPGYQFGLRDFYSGNFSVGRDVMMAVGGFDESFEVYGNEDLDLSLRLREAGVRLTYSAEAVAHQHYEKEFAALARDTIEKGRTAVQLARKHPAAFADLKLSHFARGPAASRLVRNTLLNATGRWPTTRDVVVRAMTWLGDSGMPGLHRVYPTVLDYFYWLGANAEQAEGGRVGAEQPAEAAAAR